VEDYITQMHNVIHEFMLQWLKLEDAGKITYQTGEESEVPTHMLNEKEVTVCKKTLCGGTVLLIALPQMPKKL
jgi:hypothetical protein